MGLKVGRIVKEFVFRSLVDKEIEVEIHGNKKEISCRVKEVEEDWLSLELIRGDTGLFKEGENIRVFFLLQNNYHTFESVILEIKEELVKIEHPEGVYKNPQRKYERIKIEELAEIYFTLKGQKVELNFPKSTQRAKSTKEAKSTLVSGEAEEEPVKKSEPPDKFDFSSIHELQNSFREKMSNSVSYSHIIMFRNIIPTKYEEKLIVATGKIFWIPSTEEDFPIEDPFPDDRVITKRELVNYEESFDRPAYIITSKLGNILYEKQKKKIFSEAYCPILYEDYIIGYISLCNRDEKKEKISTDLLDYIFQFSKVLSYSLQLSGYFSEESSGEHRYEAPIIDLSASGLLFAHPQDDLSKELIIHTDLEVTVKFPERKMVIGSRVRRKFKDNQRSYFGIQFLQIDPEDLDFLFRMLYGKPFTPEEENKWEGGAPPPPLDLFEN